MKAWMLDSFNGIEGLRIGEIPEPSPAADEAVLEIQSAALNPADRYLAEGQYPARPPLPHILGRDAIGTVIALGSNADGLRVGDRRIVLRGEVGVSRAGTFAERAAVPVRSLVEIPPGWTDEQAAGATLVYLTAYQALTQWGPRNSETVLVTGASGGVGVASIQLARAMGHRVVALSRSPEKRKTLHELGASLELDPREAEWPERLKRELAGRRVDLAIDNIGGELFSQVIGTLGDHGRVSVVGRLAGAVPQFNTASLFFRRIRIGGVAVGAYTNAEARAAWSEVVNLLARSGARPLVDRTFGFEDLPAAFERLRAGPMGKVLLRIRK